MAASAELKDLRTRVLYCVLVPVAMVIVKTLYPVRPSPGFIDLTGMKQLERLK